MNDRHSNLSDSAAHTHSKTMPSDEVLTDDLALLSAWAAGSGQAGDTLIDRHFAAVHRFFRNKVGTEIDDLVQQTFLACVEARHRYRGDASFKTFLLGIARHQLFRHYRSKRHSADLDFTVSSIVDLGTSPTGIASRHEDERLVAQALQRVSLDAQVILELSYWEELDAHAIAEVLEVPVNTVYSRLRRAKQSLRSSLENLAPDQASLIRALNRVSAIPGIERSDAADGGSGDG